MLILLGVARDMEEHERDVIVSNFFAGFKVCNVFDAPELIFPQQFVLYFTFSEGRRPNI